MSNEVFAGIKTNVYMKIVYSVILLSMVLGVILMPLAHMTAPSPNVSIEISNLDNPADINAAAQKMSMQAQAYGPGGGMGIIYTLQNLIGFAGLLCWVASILAFTIFKEKFDEFGESHMKFVAGYIVAVFVVGFILSFLMLIPVLGFVIGLLYSILVAFLFYVAFDMFKSNKKWDMDSYKAEIPRQVDVLKSKINKPKEG